jgi:pyruvate dehydrogenase (quinone)
VLKKVFIILLIFTGIVFDEANTDYEGECFKVECSVRLQFFQISKNNFMAQLVSDFLLERLSQWGVKRIFGFPGDGINGILGALDRAKDKIDFIQVRHEENAAFMACAHSKFTGEVGVCMATSGPGAIHLLNGLYDAKMDHQSVVAIVGQSARMAMGGNFKQEVDFNSL